MIGARPLLEIEGALPEPIVSRLPSVPLDLHVTDEDSVLIEAEDPSQAMEFAALCCGLLQLRNGTVRFLGNDWAHTPHERASALRGRIGQVYGGDSWIGYLTVEDNVLLQQLHHTRVPIARLRERAAELSHSFGLPGMPLTRPDELAFEDLVRAACVRAFLGRPRLIILISEELERVADLRPALLNALATARNHKAATIWLTLSHLVWSDRSFPATIRLRLTEHGLVPGRGLG